MTFAPANRSWRAFSIGANTVNRAVSTVPLDSVSFVKLIEAWLTDEQRDNSTILAIDRDIVARRWYVRMRGDEKQIITVWLTLREMTLHAETYFMPAPEEQVTACFEYLLRANQRLFGMKFAIGVEDAVYLIAQLPLSALGGSATEARAELDRLLGSAYAYSEECFSTAMSIGFASRYRR